MPLTATIVLSFGKTIAALLGAYLLRRFVGFSNSLDRVDNVLGLTVVGVGLSTIVSATICVASLALAGVAPWAEFFSLWWLWWLGDGMGVLLAAPPMLVWAARPSLRLDRRTIAELAVLMTALLVACEAAFGGPLTLSNFHFPVAYLPFPIVIWAALRFGIHGAVTSAFLTSVHAVVGTVHGYGPFARASVLESLILVQAFVAVIVLTALALGAVTAERGEVARALRKSQRRYDLAANAGAVDATQRSVDLVTTQYLSGLTNFQNVLDAQRSLFRLQDQLAESQGFLVQSLVQLYRSLGGGWEYESLPGLSALQEREGGMEN